MPKSAGACQRARPHDRAASMSGIPRPILASETTYARWRALAKHRKITVNALVHQLIDEACAADGITGPEPRPLRPRTSKPRTGTRRELAPRQATRPATRPVEPRVPTGWPPGV